MSEKRRYSYTGIGAEKSPLRQLTKRTKNMERNRNGYPEQNGGCSVSEDMTLGDKPLAYAYVPIQRWRMLYTPEDALAHGTLFEELFKPMEVYGNE